MHGDPNKPEPGASLRREPREHRGASGSAARDGYTVIARRPRTSFTTESVEPAKATEIERAYRRFEPL